MQQRKEMEVEIKTLNTIKPRHSTPPLNVREKR
jgi:hypothetical protein